VRTPKVLLQVPIAEPSMAAGPPSSGVGDPGPGGHPNAVAPLSSRVWAARNVVHAAREALIELRVHASSAAVMTPQGQAVRQNLLQRLHALVHTMPRGHTPGAPIGPMNIDLFNSEKGRKLLADLLPLWPAAVTCTTLTSFLEQLPSCLATQPADGLVDVPSLSAALASLSKNLAPEMCARLLGASVAHGHATLAAAIKRTDVTALLLGALCCPNIAESCTDVLASFYAVLLPVAATNSSPWALLNAILPAATQPHVTLLRAAHSALADSVAPACKGLSDAFGVRLDEHAG
jgi:hypothetical protein